MEKVTHNKGTMFLIGERLKSCRKAAGLSQEQLIDIIEALPDNMGKERNAKQISYLENGTRQLSPEYASLLAQALNVRVEYLLLKDDFRTEIEKLTDTLAGMNGIYNHILSLAALHGYETVSYTHLSIRCLKATAAMAFWMCTPRRMTEIGTRRPGRGWTRIMTLFMLQSTLSISWFLAFPIRFRTCRKCSQ